MLTQNLRYVIGMDPSGSHPRLNEGKGTTGFAVFDMEEDNFPYVDELKAEDYTTFHEYFSAVYAKLSGLAMLYSPAVFSIEDYLVYPSKAVHHTFSRCGTCMLNGYILTKLYENGYDYYIRPAVDVKNRWSDDIMAKLGYIEGNAKSFEHCHGKSGWHLPGCSRPLLSHNLDAMRHALHCAKLEVSKNRGRIND